MIPSSWTTMTCPDTLAVEKRKVAKTTEEPAEKRKADGDFASQSSAQQQSNKVAKLNS
jgi:hypothetical protein